jgi:hypothetical protein
LSPIEDRQTIENSIFKAISLYKSIFQARTILEPRIEKNLCEMIVAWKQRQFLIVTSLIG